MEDVESIVEARLLDKLKPSIPRPRLRVRDEEKEVGIEARC